MTVVKSFKLTRVTVFTLFTVLFLLTFFIVEDSSQHYSLAQNSTSVTLYPVNSKPYGLTYEYHLIKYNKYILSIKSDKSPAEDPTGER